MNANHQGVHGRLRLEPLCNGSRAHSSGAVKSPAGRHVRPGRRILGALLLLVGVALIGWAWA